MVEMGTGKGKKPVMGKNLPGRKPGTSQSDSLRV
jgi:hypothetical protein